MRMTHSRSLLAAALLSVVVGFARDSGACGAFFGIASPSMAQKSNLPFLSVERVALIYDEARGMEQFVREIRFNRATQRFGFVVPVPSRPTVARVASSPFDGLDKHLPFALPPLEGAVSLNDLEGRGAGAAAPHARLLPPPVVVLEKTRLGSFTSFVLSATDGGAMEDWLAKNGFVTTPASKAWLDHYVKLGFYYVALRFDAPRDERAPVAMTSETLRITFATPAPYYPYLEPDHDDAPVQPERLLDLWFVSAHAARPVAAVPREGLPRGDDVELVQPWAAGEVYHRAKPYAPTAEGKNVAVIAALNGLDRNVWSRSDFGPLAGLLPAGDLVVQRFRDYKVSRKDFGDVVLVPLEGRDDPKRAEEVKRLYALLDPIFLPVPGTP
jgi:hypothetical protein